MNTEHEPPVISDWKLKEIKNNPIRNGWAVTWSVGGVIGLFVAMICWPLTLIVALFSGLYLVIDLARNVSLVKKFLTKK